MKRMAYTCDRCGKDIPEDEVTKVTFSHGKGRFDLRDEEFEFCSDCDATTLAEIQGKKP